MIRPDMLARLEREYAAVLRRDDARLAEVRADLDSIASDQAGRLSARQSMRRDNAFLERLERTRRPLRSHDAD